MANQSTRLSLWVSLCLVLVAVVRSECENNSCPEEHTQATTSNLLGATQRCPTQQRSFSFDTIKNGVKELDSEVYSITWTGADDEWVWVITTGTSLGPGPHQLYKSNDKGVTFELLSPKLVQAIRDYKSSKNEPFEEQYDPAHSSVSAVFAHPANPKKVLLWADGYYHFITEDAGETWKGIAAPPNTYGMSHIVKPHPTKADWLLTIASRRECYSHVGVCTQDIFYSPDFGATWQNLTSASKFAGFTDFDWGWHAGDVNYTNLFTETTILATAHEGPLDPTTENAGEVFQLYRTDDFFKNTKTLAICGNAFELVAGQIFFARTDMCPVDFHGNKRTIDINKDLNHVTLYTSSDGNSFQEVCLPTELRDRSYMMVSAHDGRTAFVLGDHDDGTNPVSNLYANGNILELYSLSLRNVYYGYRPGRSPGSTYPDIAAITPIQGRYIANQQLSSNPQDPYRISADDFNTVAVTLITHNSGASWDKIYVPQDSIQFDVCKGACTNPSDCYLHLHGQSSWVRGVYGRPAVYASASAPGLVMASGNLGPKSQGLSSDKDKLCTWLSTDGGITWRDVADDMYIYEFFNHGNGIVMAKFREEGPANEIKVSLDRGVCWYSINITASPTDQLYIDNIRVEPDGAARIFHIMGTKHAKNAYGEDIKKAMVITIDMADVLKKPDTTGIVRDAPPCNLVSDIEDWQPVDDKGNPMCILGRFRKIKRRGTSNSPCLLTKDYARPTLAEQSCPCVANDLYCEYGYEKVPGDSSKCGNLLIGSAPACPAITEGRYKPSQSHLRLPRHGQCENLNTFIPDTDGNGSTTEQKWAGQSKKEGMSPGFIWLIVLGSLGAAVVAFVKFAPDHIKDQAMYITEPIIGAAIWAMDRVTALFNRITNRDHGDMGFERLQASNQADDSLYAAP